MTKARGLLIVGLLLCAKPGFAGVISLDGIEWQTIGLVSVQEGPLALPPDFPPTMQHTVGPTGDNAFWGLLESGDPDTSPGNVSAGALETFFGMTSGFLTSRNYISGSGMVRDFTLAAGDQLTFDWTFVTSELEELGGKPDAAMFVLDGDGDVLASAPLPDGTTQSLDYQAFMALAAGTYSIGVAVLNSTDSCCSSYLGVDDFKLNGAPVEGLVPVPEPSTLLMLTAAWGTVFVSRRLRRRLPTV